MQDYENYLVWTARFSDLVQKIQDLNPEIETIDHSNYREIFEKLGDYLRIDDVILNTENHPFLWNACLAAKNLPDHKFNIIFQELLTSYDLSKFDLCDEENNCDISKIRQDVFDGIIKFFEKAEYDIDSAMTKSNPDYNHNLHFINYEKILDKAFEKFEEFNKSEENSEDLIDRFKKTVEKYKNFEYTKNSSYNMAFKLDLGKMILIFDSEKNCLSHDFDQIKYFDIDIKDEYKNFPKFYLAKIDYLPGKPYHNLICGFGINYLPKEAEKLYLVFFEHTMNHIYDEFINIPINGNLIYTETRLEILIEYLFSKNLQTNEDVQNFFQNHTYQDLYKDFDDFYQNHIRKNSVYEFKRDYDLAHFSEEAEKMHLTDPQTGEILHHFWFDHRTEQYKNSSTWAKSTKDSESLSKKLNIFDQISSCI